MASFQVSRFRFHVFFYPSSLILHPFSMPTIYLESAHVGTSNSPVTLSATESDFETVFPADLCVIINKYVALLGHDIAYPYMPDTPSAQRFFGVEWTGGDEIEDNPTERTVSFRIFAYAPKSAEGAATALKTSLQRLARILRHNPSLGSYANIKRLSFLTIQCGSAFPGYYDEDTDNNYEGGVINLAYRLASPVT
jgi:hypothetical protein